MLPQKLEIVVSFILCHYFHLITKCRPVCCICGQLFVIVVWFRLGNARRYSLAVYVPRGLFVGDEFSENVFRCATASHKAFPCGNTKERRSLETLLGLSFRVQIENLSLCVYFTANNSWSAHPREEYSSRASFSDFFYLCWPHFFPLISFNADAFSIGGRRNCNRQLPIGDSY